MRKCIFPENIFLENKQREVVNEFKLLEIILYSKITINQHFKKLKSNKFKIIICDKEIQSFLRLFYSQILIMEHLCLFSLQKQTSHEKI